MRLPAFTILLFLLNIGYAQKSVLDSLQRELAAAPDEKKIEILQVIIVKLWLNQPDSAMVFAKQAVRLSEKMDAHSKAIAIRMMGGVFYYKGQYDSTIKYSYRAFRLSEESKDSTLLTSSMNNLGLAFYSVGSYPEALEYLLKALNLKKRIKQDYGMTQTLNNVGLVYNELKEYNKSREYFNKAIDLSKQLKDQDALLYSFNNLALTYLNEKKINIAEKYFSEAEKITDKTDNAVWESATFSGLGRVALERKQLHKAKKYFDKSLQLRQGINELNGIAEVYSFYSAIDAETNRLDSAFYFLRKSQRIARQIGARDMIVSNYKSFSDLYTKKKMYDSAFLYQSNFIALRDSLFDENLARNINDIQLQIQDEETTNILKKKDQEINIQKTQAYFLIIIVLLALVFAVSVSRNLKRERKLKEDLSRKNNEIEQQKEELLLSNEQLGEAHSVISKQNGELAEFNKRLQSTVNTRTKELDEANKELSLVNLELDHFIYKSSHDIKGPLVRLIGLCHVALLDVSDPVAREYIIRLSETAKNLSEIFDRLRIVSDINAVELTRQKIHFGEIIKKTKDRLNKLDGFNEITFKEEVEPIEFQSDPFLVETIFHNMIENAVRFQKKSTQFSKFISIKVKRDNGSVNVSFVDNGIGIRETDDKHLFQMFSSAALEHKTVGLGLYIVKQCANKLHGAVRLIPNADKYTEFELTLPFEASN